jgi:hypothetical protein
MTPFEIRLELVKLAKEMLSEEYKAKRSDIEQEWSNEVCVAMNAMANNPSNPLPPTPTFPKYFTEDDVVLKASSLNEFISNGQFLPTKL